MDTIGVSANTFYLTYFNGVPIEKPLPYLDCYTVVEVVSGDCGLESLKYLKKILSVFLRSLLSLFLFSDHLQQRK